MYFEILQLRLIAHVHGRVQRGEVTERGLARGTGISQPHLHNMLKGVRVLSPQMADILLRHLHITLLDLLDANELAASHPRDHAR
jgi:plasmid maintenance system antidote protein VapI